MSYFYFCFRKSFLIFCTVFSFYSSLHAMMLDEFEGELSYNTTTNTTRCTCRFNSSQNMTSTNNQWTENWEPNVVTGLTMGFAFLIADDLLNYDFNNDTYNSRIVGFVRKIIWPCCTTTVWPFCKTAGTGCWTCTKNSCNSCGAICKGCCRRDFWCPPSADPNPDDVIDKGGSA